MSSITVVYPSISFSFPASEYNQIFQKRVHALLHIHARHAGKLRHMTYFIRYRASASIFYIFHESQFAQVQYHITTSYVLLKYIQLRRDAPLIDLFLDGTLSFIPKWNIHIARHLSMCNLTHRFRLYAKVQDDGMK